jgi:ribonucleotide reductase beta subunit family protein with ferritin-like domain
MKHSSAFWRHTEIDYLADLDDWKTLSEPEKEFIGYILAFFAGADGVVLENLVSNFAHEIKVPEARAFLAFQSMIEVEHSIVYGLLIDTYIRDPDQRQRYFNAIDQIEVVKKKADWACKYMNPDIPFALRLIAFAIVEGVYFSGAFCAIFWLKDQHKMVKTLGLSNELIARDENLHVEFAITMFHHLQNKPIQTIVHKIVKEAVNIELEFITAAIPCKMIGMNQTLMSEYVCYVSDRLLERLGYEKMYNIKECPFPFMQKISLDSKTNFFEKRVSEYQLNSEKISENAFAEEDEDF